VLETAPHSWRCLTSTFARVWPLLSNCGCVTFVLSTAVEISSAAVCLRPPIWTLPVILYLTLLCPSTDHLLICVYLILINSTDRYFDGRHWKWPTCADLRRLATTCADLRRLATTCDDLRRLATTRNFFFQPPTKVVSCFGYTVELLSTKIKEKLLWVSIKT
jgi:hypothetical protein